MSTKRLTPLERTVAIVRASGVLRPRDLRPHAIPRQYLQIAAERGLIQRVGRGLYISTDARPTERHTFAEAGKRVEKGVICLLSALRFHGLTTQAPFEVWIAIDEKARVPQARGLPLRIVRFSGAALREGVQRHKIEGVNIHVYAPAKTVADCFKYRNKIGIDVALEALRECRRQKKATADELWHFAKVCRVANVMRPYMEAMAT